MAKEVADRAALAFLNAELRTGLTMSRIALNAEDKEKRERNRINARKAYESILHYLPESTLSEREIEEIQTRLAELRSDLQSLGEKI